MADFAVMGVRVMFQIVGEVSTLLSNNNTNAWGKFTQMVARVQQSPAHLGWCVPATSVYMYLVADCLNRAGTSATTARAC